VYLYGEYRHFQLDNDFLFLFLFLFLFRFLVNDEHVNLYACMGGCFLL
jgi:hypothetical protein